MSELYLRYVLVVTECRYMYVGLKGYIFKVINRKGHYLKAEEVSLYVGEFIYCMNLYLIVPPEMCRVE